MDLVILGVLVGVIVGRVYDLVQFGSDPPRPV